MDKKIEIEFRGLLAKSKHDYLKKFLDSHAKDLGQDDKDVYFFILPDKLVKVVNNVSKKDAALVMKLSKIGKGADFEEIEIPIPLKSVNDAVKFLTSLNITDNIMHSYQKRHNYIYKGVEIALKYSDIWKYHIELEIVVDDKSKKQKAENKIKKIADELGVKLMTDQELVEFTKKVEESYNYEK